MRSIPCVLGTLLLAAVGCDDGSGDDACQVSGGSLPEAGGWTLPLTFEEDPHPHVLYVGYLRDETQATVLLHMEGDPVELVGQVVGNRIQLEPFEFKSRDRCHSFAMDFDRFEIVRGEAGVCVTGEGDLDATSSDMEWGQAFQFTHRATPASPPFIEFDSVEPVMPASTWKLRASEPLRIDALHFEVDGGPIQPVGVPEGWVREFEVWPEEPLPWGREVTVSVDYRRVSGSTGTMATSVPVAPPPTSAASDSLTSLNGLSTVGVVVEDDAILIDTRPGFRIGWEATVPDEEGASLRLGIQPEWGDLDSPVRLIVQANDIRLEERVNFHTPDLVHDMDLGEVRGRAVSIAVEQDEWLDAPYCFAPGTRGEIDALELLP